MRALLITHPAHNNWHYGSEYPARRPMQCGIYCVCTILEIFGRILLGSAATKEEKDKFCQPKPLVLTGIYTKRIGEWLSGIPSTRSSYSSIHYFRSSCQMISASLHLKAQDFGLEIHSYS